MASETDYLAADLQSIFAAALVGVGTLSLRQRFLDHLKSRLSGTLPLRIVFWDCAAMDFAPAPIVTLGLGSRRLLRLFLTGNMSGLCAAYVSGELTMDGQAQDGLQIGITIAEHVGKSPLLRRIAPFFPSVAGAGPRHAMRPM